MYQSQEPVECDLCREPVTFFCRQCVLSLCDDCVPVHLRVKCKYGHDVVDFASKDAEESNFCESHPERKCSTYCKTCDVPICLQCAAIVHKLHDIFELSDERKLLKEFAGKKARFQSLIDQLEKVLSHTVKQLSALSSFYQKMKHKVTARGEIWHKLIEKMVKKRHKELDVLKMESKAVLQTQKKEIEKMIGKMKEKIVIATNIQETKNIIEMQKIRHIQETLEIIQYTFSSFCECQIDENVLETMFGFIEMPREGKVTLVERNMISDIEPIAKPKVPTISCVIDTGFPTKEKNKSRLYGMAVTNDMKLCVVGSNKELKLFDFIGNLHRTMTVNCDGVYICIHNGQIAFSDTLKNTVKKISENDTVTNMLSTGIWKPYGITATMSGDLLTCLLNVDQSKVVRYSSTGTVLQEIQYDSQCQPLYKIALYIAENVNGDIIVTDYKARAVIAVDRFGIFRYSYYGKNKDFDAYSLATDSVGNVFITDFEGDKVHLLDRDGQFLRYIVPEEGISRPRAVCIIGDELCVGECKTGLVKKIKY